MRKFEEFFKSCSDEYKIFGRYGQGMWYNEKSKEILTEGLITSYPFSNVMAMLSRTYSDCISHLQADPIVSNKGTGKACGISFYVKNIIVDEDFIKDLDYNLKIYGYFTSFHQSDEKTREVGFFIEPKFPFIIEHKYLKNIECYHVTNKKHLPKILKIGLVPRDSETGFAHDGNRIYLMFTNDISIMNGLRHPIGRSKNWPVEDVVILKIQISPNMILYIDPNFEDMEKYFSAFTFQNIPADNIELAT